MGSPTTTIAHYNKRAFTLTEVLISLTIGTALMAMILSVTITQGNLCTSIGNYELSNRQSRIAMKQFESDIRHTKTIFPTDNKNNGYDPKTIKLEVITGFTSEGEPTKETITYAYDSSKKQLTRQQLNHQKKVLIENLTTCEFSYFGINDNPLPSTKNPSPTPKELRKVVLSGKITHAKSKNGTTDHVLTASVVLRKPLH